MFPYLWDSRRGSDRSCAAELASELACPAGERFGDARYRREMERSRQLWEQLKQEGRDRPLHFTGWTTPQQAGGRLLYHKGAWVLHLLCEEMGADAFWRGFEAYTREHWQGSATSEDLRQAMEHASGRSLAAFFETWVYQ